MPRVVFCAHIGMPQSLTILTVADLHQRKAKYINLRSAVAEHRPDVLALVGDFLDVGGNYPDLFSTKECCRFLSQLPVENILCVRGNHEDSNWMDFFACWPRETKPLHFLHRSAIEIGTFVIVGFPCLLGDDTAFTATISASSGRNSKSGLDDSSSVGGHDWLAGIIRTYGPSARAIWLMHEPPASRPFSIALGPLAGHRAWTKAIERFSPWAIICGHDHFTPFKRGKWNCRLGQTLCVNAGQPDSDDLHYCVIEIELATLSRCLPTEMKITAFPWKKVVHLPEP